MDCRAFEVACGLVWSGVFGMGQSRPAINNRSGERVTVNGGGVRGRAVRKGGWGKRVTVSQGVLAKRRSNRTTTANKIDKEGARVLQRQRAFDGSSTGRWQSPRGPVAPLVPASSLCGCTHLRLEYLTEGALALLRDEAVLVHGAADYAWAAATVVVVAAAACGGSNDSGSG